MRSTNGFSAEVMMTSLISSSVEMHEIQRLTDLLPPEMRSQVSIVRSARANSALIAAEKVTNHQFSIQIDLLSWKQLSANQRDLLFWHEVSRIQSRNLIRFPWEFVVIGVGSSVSLLEIVLQNFLSLSFALVAIGLAGNQLYQRHRGEQSLRTAARADQGAIDLAVQFGYSFSQAYASLYDALTMLAKQTSHKPLWRKYQARLRVLEVFAVKRFAQS